MNFIHNRDGSLAFVFALAAIPMVAVVGAAIDYANAGRMHTGLRDTLDAAAVAAALANAKPGRDDETRAFVRANVASRLKGVNLGAVKVVFDDAGGKVTVSADADVQTSFAKLAGLNSVQVKQTSTATWGTAPNRISLVLDTTGSLRRSGVDGDLRAAAMNFIDIISGGKNMATGLHVALVPFASMVNIGPDKSAWLSAKYNSANYLPGTWGGCVYERTFPQDISISPPVKGEFEPHLWPKDFSAALGFNDWATTPAADFRNGVSGLFPDQGGPPLLGPNVGCMAPVIPLTNDMAAIKARIGELVMLSGSGGTLLTSGLAWGWRMLSPDWAPFWRNGSPLPQDKGTGGVLVFLSDGENDWHSETSNTYGLGITGFGRPEERRTGYGPLRSAVETAAAALGTTPTDPQLAAKIAADRADHKKQNVDKEIFKEQTPGEKDSEKVWNDRFEALCENIKKSGVTLYTISFGPSMGSEPIMMKCATSKDHYFRSPSRTDLEKAFKTIASGFGTSTTVRLVK